MMNLDSVQIEYPKIKHHIYKDVSFSKLGVLDILMIDDSKKDTEMVRELLSVDGNLDYKFSFFNKPKEALEYLNSSDKKPDLIILDLVMPSINGPLTLQELKSNSTTAHIPVIIHSSMHNYVNIIKISKLHAHAFFAKPLDIDAFEEFILRSQ